MLDFILVGYFHWGATGAAIATVTAQGVSFGIALWFLYRHGFHFDFSRKDIRLNRNLSKKILVLGAPIALQDALINVSFLIITVIVNQMGVIASASLGVVEKIIVFAMLPPMAISSAVATMTAQNYGAGLIKRINVWLRGLGLLLFSVCRFACIRNSCRRLLLLSLRKMLLWWQWRQIICEGIASTASWLVSCSALILISADKETRYSR